MGRAQLLSGTTAALSRRGDLSPEEQSAKGELKILLEGEKPRGAFVLIHMRRHHGKPGKKSRRLLIKRKDPWQTRSETRILREYYDRYSQVAP
jgi:hypothetical protein